LPEFSTAGSRSFASTFRRWHHTYFSAGYKVDYPARFMLVASMNPCPCGFYGHPTRDCVCATVSDTPLREQSIRTSAGQNRYPLDGEGSRCRRFDRESRGPGGSAVRLLFAVGFPFTVRLPFTVLPRVTCPSAQRPSRRRVEQARLIQQERFRDMQNLHTNAQIPVELLPVYCPAGRTLPFFFKAGAGAAAFICPCPTTASCVWLAPSPT